MNDYYLKNCILCPRKCEVNRYITHGFCGCPAYIRAARAGMHYYEEPFLSGTAGSGTVFFSGCNLRCVYCQNHTISGDDSFGIEITPARLAEIFLEMQDGGAHNINLVTGTPYIPYIAEAIRSVRSDQSLVIPVIWNSSGYESTESLTMLEGLVDIWLPDFKTMSPALGFRYMNASDYPSVAAEAVKWMAKIAGPAEFAYPDLSGCSVSSAAYSPEDVEESGIMVKGVCVRHLVIPGQIEDSKNVIKFLYESFGDDIWISIMSQYTPMRSDFSCPELNRTLTVSEYEEVVELADTLGVTNCMIQMEGAADESFIPQFDGTGL